MFIKCNVYDYNDHAFLSTPELRLINSNHINSVIIYPNYIGIDLTDGSTFLLKMTLDDFSKLLHNKTFDSKLLESINHVR